MDLFFEERGKRMEKLFNLISIVTGVLGGIGVALFGAYDITMKTILTFVVIDYGTGLLKGWFKKELSSEIGFKGLVKKVMIFVVIAVAYSVQKLTGNIIPLREVTIVFFICNEGLSILENAAEFIKIPPYLKAALLQLRKKSDAKIENEEIMKESTSESEG